MTLWLLTTVIFVVLIALHIILASAPVYFLGGLLCALGLTLCTQLVHSITTHPAIPPTPTSLAQQFGNVHNHVICVLDQEGVIRQIYGPSASVLGIENNLMIDQPLRKFIPRNGNKNDSSNSLNEDDKGDTLGTLFSIGHSVVPIRQPDGSLFLAEICVCNDYDYDDQILLIRDLTPEIAAQSELSERARELHTVFNTIGDPVFLIDLDGHIRNANEAARKIYGNITNDDLIYSLIRKEDEPSIEHSIQRCLAYFQPVRTEQHLQRQNRTVQLQIFPILNVKNRIRQLLCIEHDITSERLMELEVRLQHQKLQDNYRRLRELDEAKTQWLNSVSHELRTPLTSIRSFSELLLTYDDTEPETQKEFLQIIVKESDRLGRLIDELLDLARIESGSMAWNPQSCDLMVMVEDCNDSLKSIADQKFIGLEIISNQENVTIYTDRDRLQQVLINLVSNAIKFSPDGGRIIVSIDTDEEEVRLAVEDQGPGIPATDRQSIFERFSQGTHHLGNKPKGTGLGLTISHHIITFMGGHIIVTDPVTLSGARFLTTFPRTYTHDLTVDKNPH